MPNLTFHSVEELVELSDSIQPIVNLRLGDILVDAGVITLKQLNSALNQQKKQSHLRIGSIIVNMHLASEDKIHLALVKKFGIPTVNLTHFKLNEAVLSLIPDEYAIVNRLVPLAVVGHRLFIAMPDPLDWKLVYDISEMTHLRVEPVLASSAEIRAVAQERRRGADVPKISENLALGAEKVPELIQYDYAEKHLVLPIAIIKDRMFLAMANPHDKELVHEISRKTGLFIEPVLTPPEQIRTLIQTHRDKDKAKQKAENVAELATELKSAPQFLLTPRFAEESTYIKNSKSDNDDVDKGVPKNAAPLSSVLGVNSVIRDRFQLTQILGEGGMGTVYLAVDKRKQEAKSEEYNVAIKVLSQSFKDNQSAFITMEREASKTQKLSHPNIVTVNDFDRDEDVIYIVMEYLEGQSLNDFILMFHRKGMPVPKALNIVKDLGDALQYAHDKHIIHCDFKPGNAFITKKNIVKVIDFGIARASSAISKEEVPKFMDEGLLTGCTPSYATPELIFGKDPLPTDDVYALACTTYKLMTGEHPFAGHSSVEAEKLGLHAEKIKGLSRRQWAGLSKALSFNREDRTATVNEFLIEVMPKKVAWSAILISLLMFSLAGLVITQVMPLWKLRLADQMISDVEQNQLSDAELISAYYTKNLGDTATNRVRASVRLSLTGKLLYAEGDELIKNLLLTSQLPEKDLKLVLSLKAIKQKILRYYQQELAKLVDLKKERYSFAQGFSLLAQAQKVSPSSDGIEQLRSRLSQQKADLVAKLQQRIKNAIRKNQLTYTVNKDSVPKALDLFFSIAPKHSSLINGKIADHYYQHALVSLSSGDLAMSTKLLRIMQRFWPDDSRTVGLKVRLKKGPK